MAKPGIVIPNYPIGISGGECEQLKLWYQIAAKFFGVERSALGHNRKSRAVAGMSASGGKADSAASYGGATGSNLRDR